MSENIDKSSNINSMNLGKLAKPKGAEVVPESSVPVTNSNRLKEIKNENRSSYKTPTQIQQGVLSDEGQIGHLESMAKEDLLKMTNPILAAKLASGKLEQQKNKKTKKTPPNPSQKIIKKLGGPVINPKRNKTTMPGRLKGFFDDRIKGLDKLNEALKIEDKANQDKYKALAKSLFEQSYDFISSQSLIEKLDLDYELFAEDLKSIVANLADKAEDLTEPELKDFYTKLINQMNTLPKDQVIVPMLQLFLPLPFGFIFADPDEEFEEDLQELIDEDEGNFLKDENQEKNEDEDEDSDDANKNPTVIMSIKTINFNKILFVIKYNTQTRKLKLAIKGSPVATELAIPIESNLEDAMVDYARNIDYLLRLWRENVLRVTENRILKVKSTGRLDPVVLRACNSILQTIYESDIDLSEGSMLEGDYNII